MGAQGEWVLNMCVADVPARPPPPTTWNYHDIVNLLSSSTK